jgi:hypothetical protein
MSADSEEYDTSPRTVRWSAAWRWKTYEWIAKQSRNILNLVTDVESSSVVERKNKMKKTIRNKKKKNEEEEEEEEEANKAPVITFTVAAAGEFIRTRPFNLREISKSFRTSFFLTLFIKNFKSKLHHFSI